MIQVLLKLLQVEDQVSDLKEKLEVSDMKCSLLTEECNQMKIQLEELLRVKEVSLPVLFKLLPFISQPSEDARLVRLQHYRAVRK